MKYGASCKLYCKRGHRQTAETRRSSGEGCRECSNMITKKYRETHPEVGHEYQKRWRKANPEKTRAMKRLAQHIRRARLLHCEGRYTLEQWVNLESEFENQCLCCGRNETELNALGLMLTPDHVCPLAKGGRNDIGNLQPLCYGKGGCNNHKHSKWIDYRQGFPLEIR